MKSSIGWRLSLWGLSLLSYPVALQISLSAVTAAPVKFKLPAPPPRGIAGTRSAAASRTTSCPIVSQPLTAIVPEHPSAEGDQVWGLTKMEHPTFWFYIPYAKTSLADISFTLQDESNPIATKIIYENSNIAAAPTPGMIRITLPKSSPILATNKPYHWFLKLNMGCTSGQRQIFVEGWVQRVELDRNLSTRIDRATPVEKFALSAENGLWHDALTTLANIRAIKPQDSGLSQDWQNLFDTIGLGNLANQPLSENPQVDSPKETLRERVQQLKNTGF